MERVITDEASARRLKRYLITDEVAAMCRVSFETVRYWRKIGTGPTWTKAGRKVIYDENDVVAWLDQQKRGGGG